MLAEEFLPQGVTVGMIRLQADHIHGDVAFFVFQPFNLLAIGLENLFVGHARHYLAVGFPAFETHADAAEDLLNLVEVGAAAEPFGALIGMDMDGAHRRLLNQV